MEMKWEVKPVGAKNIPPRILDRKRFETATDGIFPFSVSMLSWAYNEAENILEFLERSQSFMDSLKVEYEHLLIDDGSQDETYSIAREFQKNYPNLRIIRNPINKNCGWNIRIAIQQATKEVLFWQTVDWSYDISRLGEYLWYLKDFDIVQGVRVKDQKNHFGILFALPGLRNILVKKRSDNFFKAVVSVTNYLVIRTLFRVPVLDFQNVTLYPTEWVRSFQVESHSAFTNPELLIKSYRAGARIIQVPIDFIARRKGKAKGTRWRAILSAASDITFYWFKWRKTSHQQIHSMG